MNNISWLVLTLSIVLTSAGWGKGSIDELSKLWKESTSMESAQKYDEARRLTVEYSQKGGDKYLAYLRTGYLFYLEKNYAKSVEFYQLAAKSSRGAVTPLLGLINCYEAMQDTANTVKMCRAVLALERDNYTANMKMAWLLMQAKQYSKAGSYYKKVNRGYPENKYALSGTAWCLFYEGRKTAARDIFKNLLTLDPDFELAMRGYELCDGK